MVNFRIMKRVFFNFIFTVLVVGCSTSSNLETDKNDIFDYHEQDSIYQCRREELNGTEGKPFDKKFVKTWNEITTNFNLIKSHYESGEFNV